MAAFSIIAGPSNGRMLYAGLSISAGKSEQSPFPSQKFKASLQLPPCLSPEAGRADTALLLLLLWFLRCLLSFLALAMLLLLLHQLHFLLLQLLCFFLSLFSFFRFRSSSIFRLFFFFFFFFNSSAPSDPYSRSAAPDATAAAASSTPSISNLKNRFAAKTLPKLLHFPPPLVLVLCSPSTPLLLPMLIILFQLLPPPTLLLLLHQLPSISNLKQRICGPKKRYTLPKLLYFPPLLILLTLLIQPLCFFRYLLFSFTCSRCSHFCNFINPATSQTDFATNEFYKRASCEERLSCGRFRHEKLWQSSR
jgi:hypothetical protein